MNPEDKLSEEQNKLPEGFENSHSPQLNKGAVICSASHQWDKREGVFVQGRPHIGIKGKWTRTCVKCGYKEYYSKGMFTGWFSVP